MKCVFIINPHAGEADNEEKIRREAAGIEGADCEFYVTKAVGDATEFVRNWCKEHAGEEVRFIACGGDGTINEVFNGAVGQKKCQRKLLSVRQRQRFCQGVRRSGAVSGYRKAYHRAHAKA